MSDKLSAIKEKIREMAGVTANLPFTAEVVSVENETTCTIKVSDDLNISNVRLSATANTLYNYLLVIPKVGSKVMVLSTSGGLNSLVVIKVDEVEKVKIKQKELSVIIDDDNKIKIENNDVSLFDIFQKLTDLLKNLKVFTPSGPSGSPLPDSINEISDFENKFKKLLK